MTFAVRLDAADPTPPYEQLRRQIADAIGSGVLPAGTQLPTVRQLARDLGIATGTVMRTYAELDTAGLIRSARGAGTTVADVPQLSQEEQRERLDALATTFVSNARLLGVADTEITAALTRQLAKQRSQA